MINSMFKIATQLQFDVVCNENIARTMHKAKPAPTLGQ